MKHYNRIKILGAIASGALALALGTACSQYPEHSVTVNSTDALVETCYGTLCGYVEDGIYTFKGIRYAKAERFMPPEEPDRWEGVETALYYGHQCHQAPRLTWEDDCEAFLYQWDDGVQSDDCQFLNVWTKGINDGKKRPVMVWLHGGGFDSGTSAWNPGMGLAKKDVVVVSINHRLNILGFLDLSRCSDKYKNSANVGMLDVVAALQWVRDNIRNFGGDPNNVTIFGESGGGGKVGTLLCMPPAQGLFHKAIILSGTILNVNTKDMSEKLGEAVLQELGIDKNDIDRIKDVPYKDLYAAGQRAMAASIGTRRPGTPMMWGFGPTPDGKTLLQQPFQPGFADISNKVPIIIGTTFNELQRLAYQQPMTFEQAREALLPTFGSDTDEYIQAFKETYPDAVPQDLVSIDWLFRPKTLITADEIAESRKAKTYTYMFTWRSPVTNASQHGHELKFCFNTLHHSKNELPEATQEDLKLADLMSSAWAQFAHTGNPNIKGLPKWKPYTRKNGEMMVFDYNCHIRNNPDRHLQQLIDKQCFKQLEEFRKTHP